MDVKVTIDEYKGFNRVRFERGIVSPTSDFTHDINGHRLNVSLKGTVKKDYDDAIGNGTELEERSKLILSVTDAMEHVRWL